MRIFSEKLGHSFVWDQGWYVCSSQNHDLYTSQRNYSYVDSSQHNNIRDMYECSHILPVVLFKIDSFYSTVCSNYISLFKCSSNKSATCNTERKESTVVSIFFRAKPLHWKGLQSRWKLFHYPTTNKESNTVLCLYRKSCALLGSSRNSPKNTLPLYISIWPIRWR